MNAHLTRRELLKLSGALSVSSLLAACSSDDDEEPTEEPKVEEPDVEEPTPVPPKAEGHVVVMLFLHEFTEEHVAAFEADNSGITVEVLAAELRERVFPIHAEARALCRRVL